LLADAERGRLLREGLQIAIAGKPNVGKSSLFNALVGASRAIVTEVPGTTRDLVTEVVDIRGLRVTLVDTAGLRPTRDVVEAEGVGRARRALQVADLIIKGLSSQTRPTSLSTGSIQRSCAFRPRPARDWMNFGTGSRRGSILSRGTTDPRSPTSVTLRS
jgi:tRNA U34 5-carboxymethylaminomethyl modifying GTPase MnmE/TrmE